MDKTEALRHHGRTIINILALVAAVLAAPQFGAVVPPDWLPYVGGIVAILNTVLSWLRKVV